MSPPLQLAFNPIREALYTAETLFYGFRSDDPDSYATMPDIQAYALFQRNRNELYRSSAVITLQALHDDSIGRLVNDMLSKRRVVAIMGGHKMARDSAAYRAVVRLAAALTSKGYLVCSGGGPGAMEASHLGALACSLPEADLDAAVAKLAAAATLPSDSASLVDATGVINPEVARKLHAWLKPAIELAENLRVSLGKNAGTSLAVPTWLYGHEPTTPFASDIAKYFQNSLREDGLVTMGDAGVVYTEGKAGTMQEIFQDAAQNYYGEFRPMVFLSPTAMPKYWEEPGPSKDKKHMPVRPVIEALFKDNPLYDERVKFTASEAEALEFLISRT